MEKKLYYLKIVNGEKTLDFNRKLKEGELDLINECNEILGDFNIFCDYYNILNKNLKDLEEYLQQVGTLQFKIKSPFMNREMIIQINKLTVNFAISFRIYIDHYEIKIKELAGENSKEYKKFKAISKKYFDTYFEYRFLYNLRNYIVHYKMPITKIIGDAKTQKRIFLIEKNNMMKWYKWQKDVKDDIENLQNDIVLSDFIKQITVILKKFNKEISYYSDPEVIGALKLMERYSKENEVPCLVEEIDINNGKFNITNMYDEYLLARNNILSLGIMACSSYTKEYGLQVFDPFNLEFTKEEKKKFGLI